MQLSFISFNLIMIFVGMARMKVNAVPTEGDDSVEREEVQNPLAIGEEDISQLEANPSELMGRDKPPLTMRFGASLVTQALVDSYVQRVILDLGFAALLRVRRLPSL